MSRPFTASDRSLADVVVRWSDRVLDGAVAGLAGWTVVFHLARWTGLGRDGALGFWIVAIAAWIVVRLRRPHGREASGPAASGSVPDQRRPDQRWSVAGLAVVALLLAWIDVDGLWWPVLWACIGVLLLAAVRRSLPTTDPAAGGEESARAVPTDAATIAVLLLAVVMAVLSLVMVRPDQDDVFVVNRSTWIAEHDTSFPERDTVFSDDVLPVQRPAGLPTSVEAFLGSIAALVRVAAATLAYLGLGPLVAALSVLATWRLLRGLGARAPVLATWVGTAFLILDGAEHGSFGNFSAGRSWQGKVVFLVVVVPVLWHHAAAWGRTGRRPGQSSSKQFRIRIFRAGTCFWMETGSSGKFRIGNNGFLRARRKEFPRPHQEPISGAVDRFGDALVEIKGPGRSIHVKFLGEVGDFYRKRRIKNFLDSERHGFFRKLFFVRAQPYWRRSKTGIFAVQWNSVPLQPIWRLSGSSLVLPFGSS